MKEIWKDLEGTRCRVSNYGRVIDDKGDVSLYITPTGKRFRPKGVYGKRRLYVHRVVAMMFLENPNGYEYVLHVDGNVLNSDCRNLVWSSRSAKRFSQEMLKRKKELEEENRVAIAEIDRIYKQNKEAIDAMKEHVKDTEYHEEELQFKEEDVEYEDLMEITEKKGSPVVVFFRSIWRFVIEHYIKLK